jgi:hypothetical protein
MLLANLRLRLDAAIVSISSLWGRTRWAVVELVLPK